MILDDYQLSIEILSADIKRPEKKTILIRYIFSYLAILATVYFFMKQRFFPGSFEILNLIISIITGLIIILISTFAGQLWHYLGYKMASLSYLIYIDPSKTKITKLFSKAYFLLEDKDAFVYLEGKAIDKDLTKLSEILRLILRVSIPLLGFFILVISFLFRPIVVYLQTIYQGSQFFYEFELEIIILGTLIISCILLSFYLPAWFILKDSNMRLWKKDTRKISVPLGSIRNKIDQIVGIGAIGTGWGLFNNLYADTGFLISNDFLNLNQFGTVFGVVDYFLWLSFILVISWPIIVPSVVTYFKNHDKTVNKFRSEALASGIQIGVSGVRVPMSEELNSVNEYYKLNLN